MGKSHYIKLYFILYNESYSEETITFLLRIKWWNNSVEWFHENWELLCDIEKLKEYHMVAPVMKKGDVRKTRIQILNRSNQD